MELAVPVTTLNSVAGRDIAAELGPVMGVIARGRDVAPGANPLESYAGMLSRSRRDAVQRLAAQAWAIGADAVVGLRFDSSEITQTLSEICAYGTAVQFVPEAPTSQNSTSDGESSSQPTSEPGDTTGNGDASEHAPTAPSEPGGWPYGNR